MTKHNLSTEERFLKYIENKENNENCWKWIGNRDRLGYGHFCINHKLKYLAHRFSYMVFVGEIPKGLEVCHSCDNPGCVNPKHLFLGTHHDNMQDMIKKNRQAYVKGENHWSHKLTEREIYKIRELSEQGHSQREIAKMFGISQSNVSCIKLGKVWGWLK